MMTDDAAVVERLFTGRHSCRAFTDEPVPEETIRRLLRLAQHSPSWCNTQPWDVFVTAPTATERLRRAFVEFATAEGPRPDVTFPSEYPGVYDDRRRATGIQLYESVGIARGDRTASAAQALRNFALFDAPHVAVVTTERALGTYGAVDCGVYLGHFLTAAQSLGLATVPQAALGAVAPVVRSELDLPDNRIVLFGVSFGYADVSAPENGFRTTRAEVDDILTIVT